MNEAERKAALTLCLYAALADGAASSQEESALMRILERHRGGPLDFSTEFEEAKRHRRSVRDLAATLADPAMRQEVYDMAVAVCETDGTLVAGEQWYLDELREALGITPPQAQEAHHSAENFSASGQEPPTGATFAPPPTGAASVPPPVMPLAAQSTPAETPALAESQRKELESTILNYSILNGALELLPNTLATMAIVPLQTKMVYEIGRGFGYRLDSGHVREFLAAAGVGLASQVVESYAERLVRKFLGRWGGSVVQGLAGQVASSGMSFATTYAVGHLALQYYAGGRRFGAIEIRDLYDRLFGEARGLQSHYLSAIQERSRSLDLSSLARLVRGG